MLVRSLLLIATVVFTCSAASAVTLDWSTLSWTPGTLSNSYDIDPSHPGNDITITISGNTSLLRPDDVAPNPATPTITQDFAGGLAANPSTLTIALDPTSTASAITVTVTFLNPGGAKNAGFTVFDIDQSPTYQDQIRNIQGTLLGGGNASATLSSGGSAVAINGNGNGLNFTGITGSPDLGVGSGNGNASASFGAQTVTSFSFLFGSGTSTVADPSFQKFGLSNLNFNPVPEMNPALASALSCTGAILLALCHRGKVRKKKL